MRINKKTMMAFYEALNRRPNRVPEELLQTKFLKLWLRAFNDAYTPKTRAESTYWTGICYILVEMGLMEREPERPSERAMRLAEKHYERNRDRGTGG